MTLVCLLIIFNLLRAQNSAEEKHLSQEYYEYDDDEETHVQELEVENDHIKFEWTIPHHTLKMLTSLRLMATALKGPLRTIVKVETVSPKTTKHTFKNLVGNTTYRISIEGFADHESVLYTSSLITTSLAALDWLPAPSDIMLIDKTWNSLDVTWTVPTVATSSQQATINQHLITVLEYIRTTKTTVHRQRLSVRLPNTRVTLENLEPKTVYNVTIKAGTDFGYGDLGWAAFSTLPYKEENVLRLKARTPNSLTLSWPASWLPVPDEPYTIRARTIHSMDGHEREVSISNHNEGGLNPEYTLRNLEPGSTFNVTLSTALEAADRRGKYLLKNPTAKANRKSTWAVFSTLRQGEFVVIEPRVVADTDHAASIVWHKIFHHLPVTYQVRYSQGDEKNETEPVLESFLQCPKIGCEWLCILVYNLEQHPREYSFDIRAKVDGVWNKWVPVTKSINPPPYYVENVGKEAYMREVDLNSFENVIDTNAWNYLIVVDLRGGSDNSLSSVDLSRLSDKATAEYERVPYYITANLTPQQMQQRIPFRIGDGKIYGGYLNYPVERNKQVRWLIIPLSESENEIMEPTIKLCGLREDGTFKCDFTIMRVLKLIPWWVSFAASLMLLIFMVVCSILMIITCRKCCGKPKTEMTQTNSNTPRLSSLAEQSDNTVSVIHRDRPLHYARYHLVDANRGLTSHLIRSIDDPQQLSRIGRRKNATCLRSDRVLPMICNDDDRISLVN